MSMRDYTTEPISDEDLSTILWHAYGVTEEGKRTVHIFDEHSAVKIYVIREDGLFSYDYVNHSLMLYKSGNYLFRVGYQRRAPLLLGLVWDSNKNSDEYCSAAEIGEIAQNVYFAITSFFVPS